MANKDESISHHNHSSPLGEMECAHGQSTALNTHPSYQIPSGEPPKSDWVTFGEHRSTSMPHCSRCHAAVPWKVNWCPSCGELLIGSNIENPNDRTFYALSTIRCASSVPEWFATNNYRLQGIPMVSHAHQKNHSFTDCTSYSRHTVTRFEFTPMFDTVSSAMASSHSPTFYGPQSTFSEQYSNLSSRAVNSAQYVAESTFPHCDSQVESLQSSLNQIHMEPQPIASLQYNIPCDHEQPAPVTAIREALITASNPDTFGNDPYLFAHFGRQRCISGPAQTYVMAAERSFFSDATHTDYFPAHHQVPSGYCSPAAYYNTFVTQQCSGIAPPIALSENASVLPCVPGIQMNESSIDSAHVFHLSRRKRGSECFGSVQAGTISNVNDMGDFGYRPHSFTPDVYAPSPEDYLPVEHSVDRSSKFQPSLSSRPLTSQESGRNQVHFPQPRKRQGQRLLSYPALLERGMPIASTQFTSSFSNPGATEHVKAKHHGVAEHSTHQHLKTVDSKATRRKPRRRQHTSNPSIPADSASPSHVTDADGRRLERIPHMLELVTSLDTSSVSDNVDKPAWRSLPSELWTKIITFLPPRDRSRLALVCRRLCDLVRDPSLWRVIQLHRHQHLNDSALASIGRLRPRDLRFSYCHGNGIAENGLRRLFELCGPNLHKLSFVGCTKGLFDGDLTLLLAARYCPQLTQVDASYTSAVRDKTVITLAKSARHLVSVKLNGAQQISNSAIQQLVRYHKDTLQRLELFGCFRLNSDIFTVLSRCQQLRALAFGHLHHLSSDGLLELVGKLPLLSSLDLRGTQTLSNDTNLSNLADKCPHLEEVVLANMLSVKHEAGIAQMLRRLPRLRVLDLCGLVAVGDLTMEALAVGCPQLEELDVSCTSVTHTGLSHLIRTPAKCLRCLRISNCREITRDALEKVVKACTKLTMIHAYGFESIKDWNFLRKIRPTLQVEYDA